MNKAKHPEILAHLRGNSPHPITELNFSSPLELLIVVLLSAQATDISVNKMTAKLYPVTNTPTAMLGLGAKGVRTCTKTIGLYDNRAENIVKTYRILLEQHNGEVSEDHAVLEVLPGVGHKMVDVVSNTTFGWPIIAVDTHIFRVCSHTQFASGRNVEQIEKRPLKVVPAEFKVDYYHWSILRGRYTRITRKPRYGPCITKDPCEYKEKVDI